ncbi:hypothetical protein HanIR_Chr05g0243151 [Helianthus annuus]|nr:hypothetical protein HanIR_Chr05g0243151 [Helianthus annuus]
MLLLSTGGGSKLGVSVGVRLRFRSLSFPAAATDGDVTEDTAFGPVPAAAFAEVTWLREVVVVVVTEFGVQRLTTWTFQSLWTMAVVVVVWS